MHSTNYATHAASDCFASASRRSSPQFEYFALAVLPTCAHRLSCQFSVGSDTHVLLMRRGAAILFEWLEQLPMCIGQCFARLASRCRALALPVPLRLCNISAQLLRQPDEELHGSWRMHAWRMHGSWRMGDGSWRMRTRLEMRRDGTGRPTFASAMCSAS